MQFYTYEELTILDHKASLAEQRVQTVKEIKPIQFNGRNAISVLYRKEDIFVLFEFFFYDKIGKSRRISIYKYNSPDYLVQSNVPYFSNIKWQQQYNEVKESESWEREKDFILNYINSKINSGTI